MLTTWNILSTIAIRPCPFSTTQKLFSVDVTLPPMFLATDVDLFQMGKNGNCLMNLFLQWPSPPFPKKWPLTSIRVMQHENYWSRVTTYFAMLRMESLPKTFHLVILSYTCAQRRVFINARPHSKMTTYLSSVPSVLLWYLLLPLYCLLHRSPKVIYNPDAWREHNIFDASMRRSDLQRDTCCHRFECCFLDKEGDQQHGCCFASPVIVKSRF